MAFILRTRSSTVNLSRYIRSLSMMTSDKIYELRAYTLKREKFADYIKLYTEKGLEIRTALSKLCGFWTTEVGDELNEIFHLWEYDSHVHRAAVRKALSEDKQWNTEFTPFSKYMILKQKNVLLRPASWYPVKQPDVTGGIYELRCYTFKPAMREEIERIWAPLMPLRSKYKEAIGIWFPEVGQQNQFYSLWSYKDGDERYLNRKAVFENEELKAGIHQINLHVTGIKSTFLNPTSFSPWK